MRTFITPTILFCVLLCGSAGIARGENSPDKPDFTGTWRLDLSKSQIHTEKPLDLVWRIEQKDEEFHLTETWQDPHGKEQTRSFKCNTMARACKIDYEPQPATVTLYYNGPMLVATELSGEHNDKAVRRNLKLGADGNSLQVDVLYIVPERETDNLVFARVKQN
jgi:hypothetical protein